MNRARTRGTLAVTLVVAAWCTRAAWPGQAPSASSGTPPVFDVFEVIAIVQGEAFRSLWPGFDPATVPMAAYDGVRTYLFNHPAPPEGFTAVAGREGVRAFDGQHPSVRANSRIRLGGTWTATAVFAARSRRTGEAYTVRDIAGILVHEAFHVFQALRHPDWRPNDAVLVGYPFDTARAVALRRLETDAFRRAVTAAADGDAAGWAREALQIRTTRLATLQPRDGTYEKELQRFEGTADYIERRARGQGPLDATAVTSGHAPAGIRDLGYVEGRWIAMLLDRLDPSWKQGLEAGAFAYLEDRLDAVVAGAPSPRGFTEAERQAIVDRAEGDFRSWLAERDALRREFDARPGARIVIDAVRTPLALTMFDPLAVEALTDRTLLHRAFLAARNELGSVSVTDVPCLTLRDETLRFVGLTIGGLANEPAVSQQDGAVRVKAKGLVLEFRPASVTRDAGTLTITLGTAGPR